MDLLFVVLLAKKQIPRANSARGTTVLNREAVQGEAATLRIVKAAILAIGRIAWRAAAEVS